MPICSMRNLQAKKKKYLGQSLLQQKKKILVILFNLCSSDLFNGFIMATAFNFVYNISSAYIYKLSSTQHNW